MMPPFRVLALSFAAALLCSCVGISADISVGEDGSGSISLEYRVSRLVESMGKLEGNERWLPLPYGRDTFERFVSGQRGLRLEDFSEKVDETDRTVRASISSTDLESLVRFVVSTGKSASFSENNGKRTLSLRVWEGGGPLDPDLKRLVDTVFRGYSVVLRFRLPAAAAVQGGSLEDERTALFSAPVTEIISADKPIVWTVAW
jgi:hypothetical protein